MPYTLYLMPYPSLIILHEMAQVNASPEADEQRYAYRYQDSIHDHPVKDAVVPPGDADKYPVQHEGNNR